MASSIELSNKTGGAAGPPSSVSSSQRDSEVFDEVEDESDEETPLAECCTKGKYIIPLVWSSTRSTQKMYNVV